MPKINTRSNKFFLDARGGKYYVNKSASDSSTPTSILVYSILGLTYISNISNQIYGLNYDSLGVAPVASATPAPTTTTTLAPTTTTLAPTTTTTAAPEGPSVPGAPTGLTIDGVSCAQGTLGWTPPASNGGSAITGYRIRISTNNYATYRQVTDTYYPAINRFEFQTGNPLVTGAGDIPSGSFTIRLSAVNSVGEGPYAQASATGDSTWYGGCG